MHIIHSMKRVRHTRALLLLPLALALVALTTGGCGGDDEDETTPPYASVRRYEGVTDSAEAGRRVAEGFVPIIRTIPGFIAYYWVDAGDGVMVSTSVFRDQAGAEQSNATAAGWVHDNLAPLLPNPPQITVGSVVVRNEHPTEATMYSSLRRYEGAINSPEVARRVREGFVPIVSAVPGFIAYYLVDAGGGVIASINVFRDQAGAEQSNAAAAGWVHDNLAALLPNPPQITAGDVVAHH